MEPVVIKKPLTTWQKIKAGVKGFVKTTLHYLPRGLLISGALLGVSALLGNVQIAGHSLDFMGAGNLLSHGAAAVVERLGKTLLLGGVISGSIGAWQTISAETKHRNAEIAAQADELERCRACGPERQIAMEYPVAPTSLPLMHKPVPTGIKLPTGAYR